MSFAFEVKSRSVSEKSTSRPLLSVNLPSILQHLQEHVKHVRMAFSVFV